MKLTQNLVTIVSSLWARLGAQLKKTIQTFALI